MNAETQRRRKFVRGFTAVSLSASFTSALTYAEEPD
jgi:hypothetical protein